MYKIKIAAKAKKQLKVIKEIYLQEVIDAVLSEIREDPFMGKSLVDELTGIFSYRVNVYRILYKINEKDKIITIVSAGHRSTVYQ